MAPKPVPMWTRLISRLVPAPGPFETDCWIYTGKISHGYGIIGGGPGGRTNMRTHRVTYQTLIGPIPEGLVIDHLCRVTACCNPWHLEAVTNRVNVLRGNTIPAANAAKTHCIRGHEFTPENTGPDKRGRYCKKCHNASALASAHRRRARERDLEVNK